MLSCYSGVIEFALSKDPFRLFEYIELIKLIELFIDHNLYVLELSQNLVASSPSNL